MNAITSQIQSLHQKTLYLLWGLLLVLVASLFNSTLPDYDVSAKLLGFMLWLIAAVVVSFLTDQKIQIPNLMNQPMKMLLVVYSSLLVWATINSQLKIEAWLAFCCYIIPWVSIIVFHPLLNTKSKQVIFFNTLTLMIFPLLFFWILQWVRDPGAPLTYRGSTMGNKNFFSESLVIYTFLLIAGWRTTTGFFKKLSIISLTISIGLVFYLHSLAALLAFFIGMSYVIFSYIIRHALWRKSKYRLLGLGFIIVVSSVVLVYRAEIIAKGEANLLAVKTAYKTLNKPLGVEENQFKNTNSIFERMLMWRNSILIIDEQPLMGYGMASWPIYHAAPGMGGAFYINKALHHFEHPHNEWLNLATEAGITAPVLLYILLFIIITKCIINAKPNGYNSVLVGTLLAIVVMASFGYLFHRPLSIILFSLVLCLALTLTNNAQTFYWKYGHLLLIVTLIGFLGISIMHYRAQSLLAKGHLLKSRQEWARSYQSYDKALSLGQITDNAGTPLNWYMANAIYYQGNMQLAIQNYLLAESINPYHLQCLTDLAGLYSFMGNVDASLAYYDKALKIMPGAITALTNKAAVLFNNGMVDEAFNTITLMNFKEALYYQYFDIIAAAKAFKILKNTNDSQLIAINNHRAKDKFWYRNIDLEAAHSHVTFDSLLVAKLTLLKLK